MNVFVTGANGFLGKRLIEKISTDTSLTITGSARNKNKLESLCSIRFGDLDSNFNWLSVLKNQHVVIHTAGKAHIMGKKSVSCYNQFKKMSFTIDKLEDYIKISKLIKRVQEEYNCDWRKNDFVSLVTKYIITKGSEFYSNRNHPLKN